MVSFIQKFEHNRVFTEDDSWMLFRLAAIGEACGWTLLIAGLACQRYITPHSNIPVLLAGKVHGMLFFAYMLAAVGLYPTLQWSRKRAFVALLASVPPYGSIVFERWAYHMRRSSQFRTYQYCLVLATLQREEPAVQD